MRRMDKLDYAILNVLQEQQANTRLRAITLNEIVEEISINEKTLARRINNIVLLGNISKGFKAGKAFTYYITQEGINLLEEALK